MNSPGHYAAGHPVSLALRVLVASGTQDRPISIELVAEVAEAQNVPFGSDDFDLAAAMVGLPYSPSWDLYMDPASWAEAELPRPHVRVDPAVMAEALDHLGQTL